MKRIIILGGGFAGLWAAFSAVRLTKLEGAEKTVSIMLINKNEYHGIRPRYYESDLVPTRLLLKKYLDPLNVELIIGTVNQIDHQKQRIFLENNQSYCYDKLIIALGSQLDRPNIPGLRDYGFHVDTYEAAKKLQEHIQALPQQESLGRYTIVVVGGSFTGAEVATDLMDRLKKLTDQEARVIVMDQGQIAHRFSQEMRTVILRAFKEMNVEVLPCTQLERVTANAIELDSGQFIETQTLVWTAGIKANPLVEKFQLPLDHFQRLPVDRFLHIQNIKNCFAAGDVAAATTDEVHASLLSCQHAMPQGRIAGNNAVAELLGKELIMYEQPKYVTCLDLGSWGALYTEGWDQRVIATKNEAKKIKLFINHQRIYPPSPEEGIEKLMDAAEPVFKVVNVDESNCKIKEAAYPIHPRPQIFPMKVKGLSCNKLSD